MKPKAKKIKPLVIRSLTEAGFALTKVSIKKSPVLVSRVTQKPSAFVRESLALLYILGLYKTSYAHLRFNYTFAFKARKKIKNLFGTFSLRQLFMPMLKISAAALVGIIISLPLMQAFEAHIINVTATPFQIDPPILQIPGDVGWDNPNGGANLIGNQDIIMSDPDPDATHIYYTYGSGTDPNVIPNPLCGGILPDAGGGPKDAPQHLVISADTVIKAVACDGSETDSHHSVTNTKIYTFALPCEERFIPLDVMIVFDRSGSMNLDSKLEGAKTAAKNFIDILNPARDQVGLVSFSSTALLSKQLTNDFTDVKTSMDALTAEGSTNIGDAIDKANVELSSSRARSNSTKVEIMLTDGKTNRPGTDDDNPAATALAEAKADEASAAGFILYTIGLGDDVNQTFLTDLAQRTGGQYFSAPTVSQLNDIYTQITHLICGQGKISGFKFNDLNQNGVKDAGEPAVVGWRVTLKRGSGTFGTALTDSSGFYEFTDLPGNVEFTLEEEARSGWQAINPETGKITVTLNSSSQNLTNQNFANFSIGQQCDASFVDFPENLVLLAAGDNSGNADNVLAASNVTVNGTLQSNLNVNASGGGSSRTVNGDILAGNQVNAPENFTVSGGHSILEHQSTADLPNILLAPWKTKAAIGGTVNGSLIFPNNTGGIALGPSEILGNVSFGTNNHVTIKGPLYIHGNLTLGSGTVITEDSSFGNNFAIIIVDGTINVGINSSFVASGSSGAFLLVSTANATTNGSIQIASNALLSTSVLFATEGNIHVNNNASVMALFAKHGLDENHPAINLEANVTVSGGALPGQIGCGPVISPDKKLEHIVINEFMPNAVGSDLALNPGGEWVELYNNSQNTVDVGGWVLTNSLTQTTGATQNKVWTSAADFSGGNFNNTFVESSGDPRVRVSPGSTIGSYEKVFDAGFGKKAIWQNISWHESLSVGADICIQAATSDDGITFGPYSSSDCNSPFNLSSLPQTRFLKWKGTQIRTTGLNANNADLLDLTLSYKPISFNELIISNSNTDTDSTIILPGDFLVVYRNGNPDFDLSNSSGSVNLYNGEPLFNALKIDSHVYNYPGGIPEGKSFTRMPDGTANWIDPKGTPGHANNEFLSSDIEPDLQVIYNSPVLAPEAEILPPQPGESDFIDPDAEENKLAEDAASLKQNNIEQPDDSGEVAGTSTTETSDPATTTAESSIHGGGASGSAGSPAPTADSDSALDTPPASTTPDTDPALLNNSGNATTSPPIDPPAEESVQNSSEATKPTNSPSSTDSKNTTDLSSSAPPSTEPQAPPEAPAVVDAPASN